MNKDVSLWTTDDVVAWLASIGYHRYGDNFKENDITGKHLLELTKFDLQNDLKIAPLGHRMDIVKEIDKLKQGGNKIAKVPSIVVVDAPSLAAEEGHSIEEKEHIVVLTQLVAKGSFGNVWLGRWKPNEEEQYTECAVKIVNVMDVHPHTLKRIREEINILKRLDHANIVKYFGHSERPQELHIYMEYFPLSLHQLFLQRKRKFSWLSVVEIHEIALRVAEGLKYLHELKPPVIHRDIKSKNILVKLNEAGSLIKVALCDFGVSKQISESTMANTYLGTFRWISPEVLAKRGEAYTKQTDIWSYGMVIYELLTLRAPYFDIIEQDDIAKCILNGIPPHIPPNVATRAHSFYIKLMHQCLQLEPTKRPNASEIIVQLQKVEEQMKALVLDGSMIGDTGSTIDNDADPREALMLTGSQLRSSGALAIPQQYQSSWAVIIGIESYENPEIPPVACAVNDAKAMEKALSTMGFQTICLLNKEATKEAIEEMLGDTLKWKVSINDRVCVFFACHWRSESTSGSEDDIYLLPYNCKPSKLFSSAIHIDRLKSFTKQIPVRHLLFVIDACVSKRARIQLGKGDEVESHTSTSAAVLEELMRNPAVQVITAGFKGQQCHIGKDNSIFTEMFVQGINGAAFAYDCGTASNQHSWISVDELATWLQKTVSEKTQDTQFPQYEQLDFGTGSFIFMNPNMSSTATEKTLAEEEDEIVEVPYISPPKAVPVTVIFAPPVLQNAKQGRCLENRFFELDTERKALLSTLRRTNTFLQVRVEYLKTESDLRKLGQLEGILQISDYSQIDRTELEEGELNEDESHCFMLEDEFGQLFPVSQEYLSGLMIIVPEPLKLVVVHSPNALKIAMAFLKVGIQHVICILKAEIAANFESVFYKSLLSDNASVRKCFEQAKNSLPTSFWAFVHYYENDDKLGDTSLWQSLPTGAAELLNPAKKANFSKPEIFVGRNEEVKSIINAVLQQRIVAVTGGPGVGKSAVCTIASNYLNKCRYFCDGVFLVDLRDIQPSAVPFRVGSVFGMPINTEEELYLEVAERDSLIILDGCDYLLQHDNNLEFRKMLSQLLKRTRYLKILLTSRQELNISIDNEVVFQPFTIKISELASEEATYLVSKIAPSLGQYSSRVAELFGNLPLAIHAAKMFINQERTLQSPQEIVDLLEKQLEDDVQSMQLDEFKQVKLSIESSYNTLSTELQELLLVLTLFPSTFDCESVAAIVDSTTKEMKDLLRKLLIYNLLDLEQHNRYVLHGLVRTLLAKKKTERGEDFERKWMLRYLDYYLKVLQMANQDYILGNESGLKLFDKERHNIENAMSAANVMSEEFYCNYALSGDHIFCARMSPADRIPIYEKCVNIARKNKNSIDEATFLCSLAYAFERSGEYARAEALYTQGLKLREAKLGSSHVTVAEVLKDLALLYSNPIYKQDLKQAEKLFIRTLEIREKVHGPRHPETGKSLAHLATYYRNQQQYTQSEELYARALRVLKDRLGTDCIYVARVLNNQGQLYFLTSKETEAEAKYLQSIRIMRKLAHPDRAQPLCNLANLYRKQQKFIQAELLYKEALQVREAAKETFACAQVRYSLGLANLQSKKYAEAEYNIEKALKIYDLYLGRSHSLFLKTRNKLENVYLTQNKTKEAEELRQKWDVKKHIHSGLRSSTSPSMDRPRSQSLSEFTRPSKRKKGEDNHP